jgi:peptidoglycan/LPS O-acetylase OafA/YrhL
MPVMSPIGFCLPLCCFGLSVATGALLVKLFGSPPSLGRFPAIDGLRGYLAIAVFVSHTSVWYFYLRLGTWALPPSNFYTHLGQSSVVIFFMITGFLFYSKLLDSDRAPIDWSRLYISRVFRLLPLYLFAVLVLFIIVAYLTNAELKVPFRLLLWRGFEWIAFTVLGGPDLNGVKDTAVIIAQVTWSLTYEWFFYLALPLLSLTVLKPPPARYLLFSVVCMFLGIWILHPNASRMIAFGGGIAAALMVRNKILCNMAQRRSAAILAIGCICLVFTISHGAYAPVPIALLAIAFAIFACGNTLFGFLTSGFSRILGDMSYSIYLLHGLLLFAVFSLLIGTQRAAAMSPTQHCWLIILSTPILLIGSFTTYRLIELPWMRRSSRAASWMRSRQVLDPKLPAT